MENDDGRLIRDGGCVRLLPVECHLGFGQ